MSENQPLITELLAAAKKDIGGVDIKNPVDVERYLSDLVLAIGNLEQEEFNALSPQAQLWLNETTAAYNSRQDLAAVAFSRACLQLSDLPAATPAGKAETPPSAPETRPDAPESGDSVDEMDTPPVAPVSKPARKRKPKSTKAFSKRNPWGNKTKAKSIINAVISSNGKAAHDIKGLTKTVDGGVSDISIMTSVNHALQTFDCMRQAGWLDLKNPAVQSFIKSIDEESNHV